MQSLFDPTESQAILDRIKRLNPASQGQWGVMNVAQMLAHTQQPLRVAMGDLELKRTWLGALIGPWAKRSMLKPRPFRRNMATDKSFVVTDQRQFDTERNKLVGLIQRYTTGGPDVLIKKPHPFFGPMTTAEWDILQWKHLDHHLRQFGV